MALKPLKFVAFDEPKLERFQQNVDEALRPLIQANILDGRLLRSVSLITGQANLVEHKLGRAPQGWLVIRSRAQATVWDLQDSNELPSKTLDLRCSANVTVDLWIF